MQKYFLKNFMNLENLRNEVSLLDENILELLQKRLEITDKIGKYKFENNLKIYDKNRENEILEKISKNFSDKKGLISLWQEIMNMSKRGQQKFFKKDENTIKIWIQWGKWSFNHIAIGDFIAKNPDFFAGKNIKIIFLYTTENVLASLNSGEIDFGQFAIANSIGGLVYETMTTLGAYKWQFLQNYSIPVKHSLFLHKDAKIKEIDTIMAHEQAIRQCEKNLQKNFPWKKYIGGTGELTDNASIAEAISLGKLGKNVACLGNEILGEMYDLNLFRENLQDREDNETTFVLVKI